MNKMTRRWLGGFIWAAVRSWASNVVSKSPAEAMKVLRAGNLRYAAGHMRHPHETRARMRETSQKGQHPWAVILCCSDSRVVPELIFDQGIGDLFTVRVAGNVANADEVASIEYAVEHFGVQLVLVMGHTHCGAVAAVVEKEALPLEADEIKHPIEEALAWVKARQPDLTGEALAEATMRRNVVESMADVERIGELIRKRRKDQKLLLAGCVYHLQSGKVEWVAENSFGTD